MSINLFEAWTRLPELDLEHLPLLDGELDGLVVIGVGVEGGDGLPDGEALLWSWEDILTPTTLSLSRFLARSRTTRALKWKFPAINPFWIH